MRRTCLILKIQDGGWPMRLRPVLCHREILQFVDFQDGGCPLSWNFEIEIFNSQSLHGLVVRYRVKSRGARSNCCRDIAFCRVFQVKCERTSRLIMA